MSDFEIDFDALDAISRETPVLLDLKPAGQHYMEDFHHAGGLTAVLRELKPLLRLEALTITFLGGVMGIALSYVLVWLIGTRPFLATLLDDPTRHTDIQLVMSGSILVTSSAILGLAGILSGLWPAVRASRLDPIEALRYE